MVRRFKFTMDIFRSLELHPDLAPSSAPPQHMPMTPPEEDAPVCRGVVRPAPARASSDYTYDGSDYFRYKLKPAPPLVITDLAPARPALAANEQFILPVDDDAHAGLQRRGSIVPSTAPTATNTPVVEDKAYMPLAAAHRFLCVDDNAINLRILSRLVGRLYPAATIDTTTSPHEALRLLGRQHYDLCFLDIEMPQMSGVDLATHVRTYNQRLGLIAVTTRAGTDHVREYERVGVDTTFAKPLLYPYRHIMDSIDAVIAYRAR